MQVRVKSVSPDVVVKEWEGRKSELSDDKKPPSS